MKRTPTWLVFALAAFWLTAFYFVARWGTNNPTLQQPPAKNTASVLPYEPAPNARTY